MADALDELVAVITKMRKLEEEYRTSPEHAARRAYVAQFPTLPIDPPQPAPPEGSR